MSPSLQNPLQSSLVTHVILTRHSLLITHHSVLYRRTILQQTLEIPSGK